MAEWSNAAVLKTVDLRGSGGSNPSLSATKSSDFTALFFVAEREGFVQLVAPWQTCLRVAVVCLRRYLYLQNAEPKNKFLPLHFLNPTIFDCNSPTSVYSRLLPPVESPFSAKIKRSKEMSILSASFCFCSTTHTNLFVGRSDVKTKSG